MNLKQLSPIPSQRSESDMQAFDAECDGFVDDEVIFALVGGARSNRTAPEASELILAADDMDFAGWCLPSALPIHAVRDVSLPERRPAPPELDEPGIGVPHRGSHRWWLAGLAGALSTMIFSLVLISLSNRPPNVMDVITVIRPQPKTETAPMKLGSESKVSQEITGVTPEK